MTSLETTTAALRSRLERTLRWNYFQECASVDTKAMPHGGAILPALAKSVGTEDVLALSASIEPLDEHGSDFSFEIDVATYSGIARASIDSLLDPHIPVPVWLIPWSSSEWAQVLSSENAWFEGDVASSTSVVIGLSGNVRLEFIGDARGPNSSDEIIALIAHVRSRLK